MRNRIKQMAIALLVVLSAGVSRALQTGNVPSGEPPKVPYCDVLSHFKDYDEQVLVTTSFVGVSFHSDALFHPACMSTQTENRSVDLALPNGWNSTKLGKKLEKVFRRNQIARITFEGTFHSSKLRYGADGARFRFTMQQLISVDKVSKKETMLMPTAQQKSGNSALHETAHTEGGGWPICSGRRRVAHSEPEEGPTK